VFLLRFVCRLRSSRGQRDSGVVVGLKDFVENSRQRGIQTWVQGVPASGLLAQAGFHRKSRSSM
jgi:hypothetical protein